MAKLAGPGKGCGCISLNRATSPPKPHSRPWPPTLGTEIWAQSGSKGREPTDPGFLLRGSRVGLASHPVCGTCPAQGAWANGSWLELHTPSSPRWQDAQASKRHV